MRLGCRVAGELLRSVGSGEKVRVTLCGVARPFFVPLPGFEPGTCGLKARSSAVELERLGVAVGLVVAVLLFHAVAESEVVAVLGDFPVYAGEFLIEVGAGFLVEWVSVYGDGAVPPCGVFTFG